MAQLHISIQDYSFSPGDSIEGHLFAKINSKINKSQGISLRFLAYESIKWIQTKNIPEPRATIVLNPKNGDNVNCLNIINAQIRQLLSFEKDIELRPTCIRTAKGQYYEIVYHQSYAIIADTKIYLSQQANINPGAYSYPFSIKTLEEWPSSFKYELDHLRAEIKYEIVSVIEPETPKFQLKTRKQIICKPKQRHNNFKYDHELTGALCFSKGLTIYELSFQEPLVFGDMAEVKINFDNLTCNSQANLSLSAYNELELRKQNGQSLMKVETQLSKEQGWRCMQTQSYIDSNAIKCNLFEDSKNNLRIASARGKYITSTNYLRLTFDHQSCLSSTKSQTKKLEISLESRKQSAKQQVKGAQVIQMVLKVMNVTSNWKNSNLSEMLSFQKLKLS